MQKWMLNKRVRYRLVNITILSIRFSWSEKRSSVRTLGETLEETFDYDDLLTYDIDPASGDSVTTLWKPDQGWVRRVDQNLYKNFETANLDIKC